MILNSIPLATNPNGALLLTWLLDTSGFHNRYSLLAPRFTPHLSHLCTHKLASVTVLRIVNQKSEPEASRQIAQALFFSPNDHVLSDVLGDQINGVAVVHKILQSSFLDPTQRPSFLEATKRVLIDLKVTTAQAYRRLIEEVGLPIPSFANAPTSFGAAPVAGNGATKKPSLTGMNVHHGGYGTAPTPQVITPQQPFSADPSDPSLQSVMASLHILELQQQASRLAPNRYGPLPTSQAYPAAPIAPQTTISPATFSPSSDPFLPLSLRGEYGEVPPVGQQRIPYGHRPSTNSVHLNGSADSYESQIYGTQANGSSGSNLLSPPSNGIISGSMGQIPSSPYGVAQPMPPHVSPRNLCHNARILRLASRFIRLTCINSTSSSSSNRAPIVASVESASVRKASSLAYRLLDDMVWNSCRLTPSHSPSLLLTSYNGIRHHMITSLTRKLQLSTRPSSNNLTCCKRFSLCPHNNPLLVRPRAILYS